MAQLTINKDTAVWRGIRTALQAFGGFLIGLVLAVWHVPGVPETVHAYVVAHAHDLISLGIFSSLGGGVLGFIWNWLRKDVPTT